MIPRGRRQFTAKFKQDILRKIDACNGDGDIGALLRKHGLYSSHVTTWRAEVKARELAALEPRKRGPKGLTQSERDNVALRRESAEWRARAERAELLVEIQKKVALLLNIPLPPDGER